MPLDAGGTVVDKARLASYKLTTFLYRGALRALGTNEAVRLLIAKSEAQEPSKTQLRGILDRFLTAISPSSHAHSK